VGWSGQKTGTADYPKIVSGEVADALVLKRIASGDQTALGFLYDRYGGLAFGLARRMLGDAGAAEDVVQEVFLAVWRNADGFQPSRGSVRSWLMTAVRNRCIDLLRGPRHRLEANDGEFADRTLAADDLWESVVEHLEAEDVQRALACLPEEQRITIHLAFFKGLTHAQIAAQLDVPLGTVKGRMRLGLEKLRNVLGNMTSGNSTPEAST